MIEKCMVAVSDISTLEVLSVSTVRDALEKTENITATRTLVTDEAGMTIYDSDAPNFQAEMVAMLPEISKALDGYKVFTWRYHDGVMYSRAAAPVYSYGVLTGCVYMMDYDAEQGALIKSLQLNILSITIILEIVVVLFSFGFAKIFSSRMRRIMTSLRTIRQGDYTHRVKMGGRDELTVLGNEFNDLTEKLQTSENKRRQFVSDASHELKTPLASIKLLSDSILQNEMDSSTIHEFVSDIGNEADRLNRMSQKLLSLSRIESQENGECEIVYMAPTIKRVSRMLSAMAGKNNISIVLDLDDDCPILILEDDLYQITFNLVENGIKYNIPGGTLMISLQRHGDIAEMKVTDTGVGIPDDAVSNIFERFFRVDKARSRKTGGSGLGLSIVRDMVERNGGNICVSSTYGAGSTFTVTFPVFDTEVDKE